MVNHIKFVLTHCISFITRLVIQEITLVTAAHAYIN